MAELTIFTQEPVNKISIKLSKIQIIALCNVLKTLDFSYYNRYDTLLFITCCRDMFFRFMNQCARITSHTKMAKISFTHQECFTISKVIKPENYEPFTKVVLLQILTKIDKSI